MYAVIIRLRPVKWSKSEIGNVGRKKQNKLLGVV